MLIDRDDGTCLLTWHVGGRRFISICVTREAAERLQDQLEEILHKFRLDKRQEELELVRRSARWDVEDDDV